MNDPMIVTDIEIGGMKGTLHTPNPNYECAECHVTMAQRRFLYDAAAFVVLVARDGVEGLSLFSGPMVELDKSYQKAFPKDQIL